MRKKVLDCEHCGAGRADFIHEQRVDMFVGNSEFVKLCKECFAQRDELYPQWTRPRKSPADYPEKAVRLIKKLTARGYIVKKLSDYQFRINGVLDLYPVNMRYHNIKTQERGDLPVSLW